MKSGMSDDDSSDEWREYHCRKCPGLIFTAAERDRHSQWHNKQKQELHRLRIKSDSPSGITRRLPSDDKHCRSRQGRLFSTKERASASDLSTSTNAVVKTKKGKCSVVVVHDNAVILDMEKNYCKKLQIASGESMNAPSRKAGPQLAIRRLPSAAKTKVNVALSTKDWNAQDRDQVSSNDSSALNRDERNKTGKDSISTTLRCSLTVKEQVTEIEIAPEEQIQVTSEEAVEEVMESLGMTKLDCSSKEPEKEKGLMDEILFGDPDKKKNFGGGGGDGGLNFTVACARVFDGGAGPPPRPVQRAQVARRGGARGGGVQRPNYGGEGRDGSCRLKDLEGRRTTKRGHDLPPDDENWMAFAPGFNVEGHCENRRCRSQRGTELPILRQGYGNSRLSDPSLCPACSKKTLKPGTVLVCHARALITFKKRGVNTGDSTLMEHLGEFPQFVTPADGNDKVDYDVVEITTVKPDKSPYICHWCDLAIKTKAEEILKRCGHSFHKKCCSRAKNCRICRDE